MRRRCSCLAFLWLLLPQTAWADTQTLEQAWVEAYRVNPSLEAERARLRATDEQVSQAQSHWRPSIDATANIGKTYQYLPAQKQAGLDPNFTGTARSYGVQVTQPLFRGFRTDSETEVAENQVLSGRAKLDDAEEQLFLDTATVYLDLVRDMAILDSNRNNEHVLERKLDETRVRARFGDLTQTDVRQAESRLARAHVARYQAETAVTQDRAKYMRLVGVPPEKLVAPRFRFSPPKDMDFLFRLAERHNPKVVAARFDMDAAQSDVDLNEGSLLPEINLVGSRTQNWRQSISVPGQENSSQIMIQATMPLYRSGADYSKVRAAEQTVTQRRMELEDVRNRAREQARDALQTYQSAAAAVEADKDEVRAANEALKGVREEAKTGTRTTLDVLNAEQELLDAKIDMARSVHDRTLAILQIKAAIGELTVARLELNEQAYDPALHYHDVRNQWVGFSEDDERYGVPPPPPKSPPAAPKPSTTAPAPVPDKAEHSEISAPHETASSEPPSPKAAPWLAVATQAISAKETVDEAAPVKNEPFPSMRYAPTPNNLNKKIPDEETQHAVASTKETPL